MAKSIKELKKENSFLKSKSEKSDITLIELVDEVSPAYICTIFPIYSQIVDRISNLYTFSSSPSTTSHYFVYIPVLPYQPPASRIYLMLIAFFFFRGQSRVHVYFKVILKLIFLFMSSASGWKNSWRKQRNRKRSLNHCAGLFRQKENKILLGATILIQLWYGILIEDNNIFVLPNIVFVVLVLVKKQ